MPRVKGPLFSLTASGTYDRTLVFRTSVRGTAVSRRPRLVAARSPAQISNAQRVNDMARTWVAQSGSTQGAWNSCAALQQMSGYQLWWREWYTQNSTPALPPTNPCP